MCDNYLRMSFAAKDDQDLFLTCVNSTNMLFE